METKSIGILGCGWLGKALAKKLITKNYSLKGSVTRVEGIKNLEDQGIQAFQIDIDENALHGQIEKFLKDIEILIIAIPPKFKKGEEHLYAGLKKFFETYDLSGIKKLVYISSTGVFKDGKNKIYTEDALPNNNSERGKYLIKLENLILDHVTIADKSIVRLGGLIKHQGRHPIKYLSGRENVPNPDAVVNLIEQTDAVNLLIKVIESDHNALRVYHGVNPNHTSRKEYYTKKALDLHLKPPLFTEGETSIGKTISSEITSRTLNFKYKSGL